MRPVSSRARGGTPEQTISAKQFPAKTTMESINGRQPSNGNPSVLSLPFSIPFTASCPAKVGHPVTPAPSVKLKMYPKRSTVVTGSPAFAGDDNCGIQGRKQRADDLSKARHSPASQVAHQRGVRALTVRRPAMTGMASRGDPNSGARSPRRRPRLRGLRLHAEQARRVAAEDRDLLVVAQRGGGEHVVGGVLLPWERMVAAEHDLAGADLRGVLGSSCRAHGTSEMALLTDTGCSVHRRTARERDTNLLAMRTYSIAASTRRDAWAFDQAELVDSIVVRGFDPPQGLEDADRVRYDLVPTRAHCTKGQRP
jgi:hypothetical protein